MSGACSSYGNRREVYRLLVGKLQGKRPLGSPIYIDGRIIFKRIFKTQDGKR